MNTSIKMNSPCELLNITPLNPLISKCEIKVCYVGDKPNRNKSIITKEVATEMANSLPGSPIVGYYNEVVGDFEEHNKILTISNGKITIKDNTRPYGFVDLNAKVWFQKYSDNGVEHEYLMTEGYLWTGQWPEAKRIIEKGNNQSMELDNKFLDAVWTKDNKGKPQFFIINEAIISKLCILGDACEPCFEGAQITAPTITFSYDDSFQQELYSMMSEIKTLLQKGGNSSVNITTYAVEIGDALWCRVHDYLVEKYPDPECDYCTIYRIRGIFEEDGQKYVLLATKGEDTIYKMNFVIDGDEVIFGEELIAGTMEFVPVDGLKNEDEVNEFALQYAANHAEIHEEPVIEETAADPIQEPVEPEPIEEEGAPAPVVEESVVSNNPIQTEEPVAVTYNLEEIPEYVELATNYANLIKTNNELQATISGLQNQIAELSQFKQNIEKKDKQAMIDSFYMLSDEDKKDVQDNIDTYSLDDIEAKLSIICVRNRVNFSALEDNSTGSQTPAPTTYNLQHQEIEDESVPAWVKRVREVAKNQNN